jgi:hypothetical protein
VGVVPAPPHRHVVPARGRTEPELARPLRWLLEAQNADGGWGDGMRTPPDVATTAITGLALLRLEEMRGQGAGAKQLVSATASPRREAVRKAVAYVTAAVERAPADQIPIERAGTQPQRKLGRNIDTFVGAQFLAEALQRLRPLDGRERARIKAALQACVKRIERAQNADGSYEKVGWAPILSSAFANEGLEAAERAGAKVDVEVLARGDRYMLSNYDPKTRGFKTGASAGVGLYAVAGAAKSAVRSRRTQTPAARAAFEKLGDDRFVRGFGSYGGEEHVSYMLTTEALARTGGKAWAAWSKDIRQRLASIQRENGTWRGDHCITSTTFCTAASLITLAIKQAQA